MNIRQRLVFTKAFGILLFGVMVCFLMIALAWVAGYWGNDEFQITIALQEALFFAILISGALGSLLWYTSKQIQQIVALKQHLTNLHQKLAVLQEEKQSLVKDIATQQPETIPTGYPVVFRDGKVYRGTQEIELTPKEFQLLTYLIENTRICEKEELILHVWSERYSDPESPSSEGDLNPLIHRLREKINIRHDYVKNHRGRGYEFVQWTAYTLNG